MCRGCWALHQDCDWTIFWRQLAELPVLLEANGGLDDAGRLAVIRPAFNLKQAEELRPDGWLRWLADYEKALAAHPTAGSGSGVAAVMKAASPKFVPREWMLVDAYTAAQVRRPFA